MPVKKRVCGWVVRGWDQAFAQCLPRVGDVSWCPAVMITAWPEVLDRLSTFGTTRSFDTGRCVCWSANL